MRQLIILISLFFLLNSCAEILKFLQQSNIQKPTAQVTNSKITGLSFTQADLLFDVQIDNPNTVSINLAGMDYSLKINENALFSGNKTDALAIAAQGASSVQIPVTLKYEDIYKAVSGLADKKNSTYSFDGGLSFNLPVLGNVRLPISTTGEIPLIKLPKVKVKSINLDAFSWSGASLNLNIAVAGNGGMDLLLDNLSYGLKIGGKNWINGNINKQQKLSSEGEQIITVPFKLDFLQMGRTVYDIVKGDATLDYSFTGDMKISADNPLLKTSSFSFSDLNQIKISK